MCLLICIFFFFSNFVFVCFVHFVKPELVGTKVYYKIQNGNEITTKNILILQYRKWLYVQRNMKCILFFLRKQRRKIKTKCGLIRSFELIMLQAFYFGVDRSLSQLRYFIFFSLSFKHHILFPYQKPYYNG